MDTQSEAVIDSNHKHSKKRSFIMYSDNINLVERLKDEDAGKLFKAIMRYEHTQIVPEIEYPLDVVFETFKRHLDENRVKHIEISKERAEFGRMGGLAKASKSYQSLAKRSESESESESVSETSNKDSSIFLSELREERRKLIDEWLRYKKDRRETYKPASIKKLIEKWSKFSDNELRQVIDTSISNGWSGLFEPKNNQAPKKVVYTRGL